MKRFLLLSVMFCIGVLQGFAQDFEYKDDNGVTWSCYYESWYMHPDGTLEYKPYVQITGASGYGNEVVVPKLVIDNNGKNDTVSSMGSVFRDNKTLKKVTLPKTIKSLFNTFSDCSALTEVENTAQITNIGDCVFLNCSSLISIDLSSCENIGNSAFSNCSNLKTVTLKACKSIASNAFFGCNTLTSVGSTSLLTTINYSTFSGCLSLESIDLSSCTSIGDFAFSDCQKLKSIDLSLCTTIGESAFSGCNNLNNIKGIEQFTTILYGAFSGTAIESLSLPLCTTISAHAFDGCKNLKTINLPKCESIGQRAFSNCSSLEQVSLPVCLTVYGGSGNDIWDYNTYGAFENCTKLEKIDLPKCTTIGAGVFKGCKNISSINVPVVESIGERAFSSCNSLNNVSLPESIKELGYRCFDGNTLLTIYANEVPNLKPRGNSYQTSEDADTLSLGNNVLIQVPEASLTAYQSAVVWEKIKERIFPMGTQFDYDIEATAQATTSGIQQKIPEKELKNVVSLKVKGSINSYDIMIMRNKMINLHYLDLSDVDVIANSYEYYTGYCTQDSVLGPHSFADLSKLVTVKLPNSVKYIYDAFTNCSNLKSVVLPESLISMNYYYDNYMGWYPKGKDGTFSNCKMLKEIVMPSCQNLGYRAFNSCNALESITLPKNLKRIGIEAFAYSSLKSVIIPDSVESIGSDAFRFCDSLKSVEFPPSLKSIDREAFQYCTDLESISLPGLTYIAENTFDGCSKLQEVKVPSTLERIGDKAFDNCNNINEVWTYTVLPINIDQKTFTNFKNTILYVPTQSYNNYYWNTQWSQFLEIREFDEPYKFFYLGQTFYLTKTFKGTPSIEIREDGALAMAGTETQDADIITIKSNGTSNGGAIIGNGNLNAKSLKFNIAMEANQWYFLSFPFNIKTANIKAPGKYAIRKYDGARRANNGMGGWVDLAANEDVLQQGIGYIFQSDKAGELELTVEKEQFGNMEAKDINTPLNSYPATNVQDASWNFIGNTQTSYMDVDHLGYDAPITYWNGSTYEAVRPGDDEMTLHPFQAFFVQKPTDVNEIEFKAEDRLTKDEATNKTNTARSRRIERGITPSRLLINLAISDGKNEDKTRIVFNDKKSQAYELDCDAAKFETISDAPQLYSIEAQAGNLAINERPMGSVNLGFTAKKAGDFTISAKRMDQPMLLQDNTTGTTYDLTDGDYQFSSGAGTFNSRFVLVPTRGITGIADIVNKTGVNIMPTESGLNINDLNGKDVSVYSTNGMLLATRNNDGMLHLQTGVYIVKVDGMSTKVMVK